MYTFSPGNYLGTKVDTYILPKIIISKAEYGSVANRDWHCHQNAFFAYFLKGGNCEYRKTKEIKCTSGSLLFYKALEPHCNKDYVDGSKIFHVEIDNAWLSEYGVKDGEIRADVIDNMTIKNAFINILNEFSIRDELSPSSVEHILIYLLNLLQRNQTNGNFVGAWLKRFNTIIKDNLTDS